MSPRAESFRDMNAIIGQENNRQEFVISSSCLVDPLIDYRSLPINAKAEPRLFLAFESKPVFLRADNQDELGGVDLVAHPLKPALRWRGFILVDMAIHSVCAQPVGKL